MDSSRAGLATIEQLRPADSAEIFGDIDRRRIARESGAGRALRCVSSGYLADGCSCRSTIPTGVVAAAWAREQRAGARGDRFFHFAWRDDVWLAYGLQDGCVRGVYCPAHSVERDRRLLLVDSRERLATRECVVTA